MKNITNQKLKTLWRKNSHPLIPQNKNKVNVKSTGEQNTGKKYSFEFEFNINLVHLIIGAFLIYIIYQLF